jgi:hypothetical protein
LLGKSSAKEAVDWLTSLNEPFDVQILAGIVKGSQGSGLDIESCLNLLERFEHSSKNTKFIFDCAEVLLKLDANVEQLDRLLIVLLSVGGESGHSARSISLLEIATARMNHKNVPELMQTRLQSLWNLLPADEIASGDTSSRPWNILNFVIHRLEKVDAVAVKIILQYLLSNSSPEITLKSLNLLTASMPKLDDCSRKLLKLIDHFFFI